MATGDIIAFQIMGAGALPTGGNIDGNGVIARIRLEGLAGAIGGSYDLAKLSGSGASPGWNRAKVYSATNTAREIALTGKIVRRPFPSEALRIEQAVGGDLDIYAYLTEEWFVADTLASVSIAPGFYAGSSASTLTGAALSNSSTRAYRLPQISWVGLEPWRRMTAAGLTVEAIVDHHNARDGQPVPAVDFYVSRAGVTETATSNAMQLSNEITAPFRPGVFRATVPLGTQAQGEGDLGAIVYPWVGTAAWDTNTADFPLFPCIGTPRLYPVTIDSDGSYAPAGAYVSHTGAQIGTPAIGLLTAQTPYVPGTTPAFATIQALMNAARAFNSNAVNRARPHDDMAGVFAVIPSGTIIGSWGTASLQSTTTYPPGTGYCGIRIEAGASRGNTGLTSNSRIHPSRFLFDGVGLFPGAAGGVTHIISDGGNTGAPVAQPTRAAAVYLVARNCIGTGNNDNANSPITRAGYRFFHNNSFTSFGDDIIASNAAQFNGLAQLHGCTINNNANAVAATCPSPSIIGCHLQTVQVISLGLGAAPDVLGRMVHSTRIETDDDGAPTFTTASIAQNSTAGRAIGVRGESWVNVLVRKTSSILPAGTLGDGSSPAFQISADFASGPTEQPAITNINMAYVSIAGARRNGPYQEVGAQRTLKELREIGIAAHQWNAKGDLFTGAGGASGVRTGTFAFRHGNARFGCVGGDNSNTNLDPGPSSLLGDVLPPLSTMNVGYANMWVNDTSLGGSNLYASPGDYTPKSALFARIPAGRAATAFDLSGLARRNDGFGAAGAIERPVASLAPAAARSGQLAASPDRSLLLPLASAGAAHEQRGAVSSLLWVGGLVPIDAEQGQAAAIAPLLWATVLASADTASPHHAGTALLTLESVVSWLLPVYADQPQTAGVARLLSGIAVTAARTLVPDPRSTTHFVR